MSFFSEKLIEWYRANGRDLPWRNTSDPYRIWISEIILQQTRVAQGYDYYIRFMERFPDVETLAGAEEEEVMRLWQGLGYYSRARNLHAAAKSVVAAGKFPDSYEGVRALKGVGDYTAAAICSFAYGMPCAVVDGNVYRVLARWLGVDTPIDTSAGKKEFAVLAQELLDKRLPAVYNQAIMDFGATVCTPQSPGCTGCPLAETCVGLHRKRVGELPRKARKTKVINRYFHYVYLHSADEMWLQKRGEGDIWQNLYELPLIETESPCEEADLFALPDWQFLTGGMKVAYVRLLEKEKKHLLSHRCIYASCYEVAVEKLREDSERFLKVPVGEMDKFPVSNLISHFFSLILKPNHKNKQVCL